MNLSDREILELNELCGAEAVAARGGGEIGVGGVAEK